MLTSKSKVDQLLPVTLLKKTYERDGVSIKRKNSLYLKYKI